jgi:hypothetical protein
MEKLRKMTPPALSGFLKAVDESMEGRASGATAAAGGSRFCATVALQSSAGRRCGVVAGV